MDHVVAVDLGGTKLTTAVLDASGTVSRRRKQAVDRTGVHASAAQIAGAIREAASSVPGGVRSAGLIVPGIYFAGSGNVWAPNLWGHDKVPLRAELERLLDIAVVMDSDRAGSVLGERWRGAARGLDDVVFLGVGTGIGAGIVSGGRLLRGAGDIAGAVGWFALNPVRTERYGKIGCWEAESAGPSLARRLNAECAEDVVAAARAGDPAAVRAVDESARYLGMGIANIVSLLNPRMVVLGGGLMQAGDLFLERVRVAMAEWAQPVASRHVRVELTTLGEDAGLFGAAWLALGGTA